MAKEHITTFPRQQISDKAKTPEWYKKNLEAGIGVVNSDKNKGLRNSRKNKIINYQLGNNILNPEEMERILNPWNIKGFEFPYELENFPLINPKIDLLVGESIKRLFNPIALAVNSDAISEKEEMIKSTYLEYLANQIMNEGGSEEEVQQGLEGLNKWKKWNSQDLRERMVQQIINYHSKYQRWDTIFKDGFKDLLYAGEEIYRPYILGGEPALERVDPLDVTVLRMGNSHRIQDADVIIHRRRLPVGKVLDEFYEYLTESESKKLENVSKEGMDSNSLWARPQAEQEDLNINDYIEQKGGVKNVMDGTIGDYDLLGDAFDEEGNVRVVTVYWKSKRKVGVKTYYNELGELTKDTVTENYVPDVDGGEEVKWYWISEWLEATEIAGCIQTKMQPFVINQYGIDNFVLKTAPMVGVIAKLNSNKAMSLMDRAKPYQYLYNAFMHNARKALIKSRGKIPILDAALVPDGWSMDKYLYYLEEMNIMWVDSFKEGNKGAMKGQLAGNMASQQRELNLELSSTIQQYMLMLQFLQNLIGEITGVTEQRQGQIQQRELVGNVERSVVQSSHITEEWFSLHDEAKLEAITMFVEFAKYAYRNKKEKRAYILDDMSSAVLDIDGELLSEMDCGIFLENASDSAEVIRKLEGMAQAWAQNDRLTTSQAAILFSTKSPSVMMRKFEEYETEFKQREDQARQEQLKSQEAMAQQAAEVEKEKLRIEEEDNIRQDETKRYIAELSKDGEVDDDLDNNELDDTLDREKLDLQKQKQADDKAAKDRQMTEVERSNKVKESIAKSKPNPKST